MTTETSLGQIHPARETFILNRALALGRPPFGSDPVATQVLAAAGWPDRAAVAARYRELTGRPEPERVDVPVLAIPDDQPKGKPTHLLAPVDDSSTGPGVSSTERRGDQQSTGPAAQPAPMPTPAAEAVHEHGDHCTAWPPHGGTFPDLDAPPGVDDVDQVERPASPPPPERPCPHGDPTCPCQDGDLCHYEADHDTPAMTCTSPDCTAGCRDLQRATAGIDLDPTLDQLAAVDDLVARVQQYRPDEADPEPAPWDGLCDVCHVRVNPEWAARTGHRRHLHHLNEPTTGATS
jgi:hypothetical protein